MEHWKEVNEKEFKKAESRAKDKITGKMYIVIKQGDLKTVIGDLLGGLKLGKEEHIARHKELHNKLDELLADFINHTKKLPSKTTLMEFLTWSSEQTTNPTGDE